MQPKINKTERQSFILQYLKEKYNQNFNILKEERITSEADINISKTITIYVQPTDFPDEQFLIFLNEAPKLVIKEDQYPQLLLQLSLQEKIHEKIDANLCVSVKLSYSPESLNNINSKAKAFEFLKTHNADLWSIYISIIAKKRDKEKFKTQSDAVIKQLKSMGLRRIILEVIYYYPGEVYTVQDLKYNIYGNYGERYPYPGAIIEKWIGQFGSEIKENYADDFKVLNF